MGDTPNRKLRCWVVVDRSSVEHRLGKRINGRSRKSLSLLNMKRLLEMYGFEVRGFTVGHVGALSAGLEGKQRETAERILARDREWFASQVDQAAIHMPDVSIREVVGATDGHEVGVDIAVAAAALDVVGQVAGDDLDLVLTFTHDSDLTNLYQYSLEIPVLATGSFSGDEYRNLGRRRVPSLRIPDEDFKCLAAGSRLPSSVQLTVQQAGKVLPSERVSTFGGFLNEDLVLVGPRVGKGFQVSGPLDRSVARLAWADGVLHSAHTVVVFDPYGLFNSSVGSIGTGNLPDAESVREVVAYLGWDYPIATLATVPDVEHSQLQRMDPEFKSAWRERDDQLDSLAEGIRDDGDPLTIAARTPLLPGRAVRPERVGDFSRGPGQDALKSLGVSLLCDLWFAQRSNSEAELVLISDDADLRTALDLLPLSGINTFKSVVRVGPHAAGEFVEPVPGSELESPPYVVLSEDLLALLSRIQGPFGGEHRRSLHESLGSQEVIFRVGGRDPETGGRVLNLEFPTPSEGSGLGRHAIQTLLFGEADELRRVRPGKQIQRKYREARLAVTFDHHRRCAHPVLSFSSELPDEFDEAVVLDQWGHWISIDVDGDGVSDGEAPVGHEGLDFEPGQSVGVVADSGGIWDVVDPQEAVNDRVELEIVRMDSAFTNRERAPIVATGTALEDGKSLPVVVDDGRAFLRAASGDYIYALRRDGREGSYFAAMSSPLGHLKSQLEDTGG